MVWEKSQGEFVESDVVEWTEAIWSPKKYKRGKSKPWGKQKVVAQVTHIEGDHVKLKVLKSSIIENILGSDLRPHKVGSTITKKRSTLVRGNPERLHWSEEDVRAALLAECR